MGLQIWLPLNGSLENKGLTDVSVTNDGASIGDDGKIGKCYNFGTAKSYLLIPKESMTSATEATVCFWLKILSWNASYATFFQAGKGGYSWNNYIFGFLRYSTYSSCCFTISNGSTASNESYLIPNLELNTWYHIGLVYKSGHCLIYINGDLYHDYDTSIVPNFGAITTITVGASNHKTSYQSHCSMNDLRIYDEALSPMQIKLISQGLVAHYLLNRNSLGAINLLKNGFGELGAENWQDASNMYDDVPANHPEIYHSYKNVTSVEYIPIYRNHTYQFSTWVKAASSSGSSYPSLSPYDADKNFIYCYNCTEGFNLSTMTTLTQELKKGDTKIYVDDLSKWNANSGNYYNYAALFGYKDSTGYIYPDGFYTQDLGIFATGKGAKTNLDKTNNIITLISAYTGANKPIGTKVCASTAGGSYYYPLGGINNTTITDWTYKEGTFSSEVPRLSAAKYVKVYAFSSCYQAGITLTDLTLLSTEDNIEYDVSGYCHNGTKYNIADYISDTPRYSASTKFNGTNSYINVGRGGMVKDEITINLWAYMDDWTNYNNRRFIACTEGGGWNFESVSNGIRFSIGTGVTSNTYVTGVPILYTDLSAGWHMFTGVYDGFDNKIYLDGNYYGKTSKYTTKTPVYYHKSNDILIGAEATNSHSPGGSYFKGNLSDIRIYATALSDADILSLYNNSAFLDSSGNMYATEYIEE